MTDPSSWVTSIIAVILNYSATRGTWLESHFRWQIRNVWFGLLCIDCVLFIIMTPVLAS